MGGVKELALVQGGRGKSICRSHQRRTLGVITGYID